MSSRTYEADVGLKLSGLEHHRATFVALGLACVCLALVGAGLSFAASGISWGLINPVASAVLFTGVGAYLVARVSVHGIGGLLLVAGIAWSAGLLLGGYGEMGLGSDWPGATMALWASTWLWPVGLIAPLCLVPLLFPNGRAVTPRWRVFSVVAWSAVVSWMLSSALLPGPMTTGRGSGPDNPAGVVGPLSGVLQVFGQVLIAVSLAAGLVALVVRWRSGNTELRQQLKYLIAAMLFVAVVQAVATIQVLLWSTPAAFTQVLFFLIPVAIVGSIGLAVARYRLYDIDTVIRTAVLYFVLIGFLLVAYAALVTGLTSLATVVADPAVPVIAALSVALLLEPSRRWLHTRLDRWFFGGRAEPMRVLAHLRSQLDSQSSPPAALAVVVQSVAAAVRSPYVAVVLLHDDGVRTAACAGSETPSVDEFSLLHHGELVGRLLVAPRRPGEQFNAADKALLIELAGRASSAAANVRMASDLESARRRAYRAAVEERAQLGRDLHDGLGPLLAGTNLALESVRRTLNPDDAAFTALLAVGQRLKAASNEVRRIARSLSPGPLAQLGLSGALEDFVQGATDGETPSLALDYDIAVALPPAVEQVAYLVSLEATHNALRHAHASHIRISLTVDRGTLIAEVADDGIGLGPSYLAGVGLTSMRQRCDAVGGQLSIHPGALSGTVVTATVPVCELP